MKAKKIVKLLRERDGLKRAVFNLLQSPGDLEGDLAAVPEPEPTPEPESSPERHQARLISDEDYSDLRSRAEAGEKLSLSDNAMLAIGQLERSKTPDLLESVKLRLRERFAPKRDEIVFWKFSPLILASF